MGLPVDWMKFSFAATAYQSYIFGHEIPFGVLLFLACPPPRELICLELAIGTPLHLYQAVSHKKGTNLDVAHLSHRQAEDHL